MKTRITEMLGIRYPIIQAGMSWASSSPALPAAVSNAGGLGVLAAGPMHLSAFDGALAALKAATAAPYAVNIPLYRPEASNMLDILHRERTPVLIASQGGPKAHLPRFREIGTKWIHVVSTLEHARKAAAAGVDAIIVVGSEAGGHPPSNGVSTLVTVRRILQELDLPVIAGGGVADGYGIAALLALGADAVQLGTRFLMTPEATVHEAYKAAVLESEIDGPVLVGRRSGAPVRMLNNRFAAEVAAAEVAQVSDENYAKLFASSTLKVAALGGDIDWGKVEAGQSAGLVHDLVPAAEVVAQLVSELREAQGRLSGIVNS